MVSLVSELPEHPGDDRWLDGDWQVV